MPYSATGALGAGIFVALVTALILYSVYAFFPRQLRLNPLFFLGAWISAGEPRVLIYPVGAVLYTGLSVLFALVHAGFYQVFGVETSVFAWGVLFGTVQWVIDGIALGMAPLLHPKVRAGALASPGAFALNYPMAGALGFLVMHLLYGMLVGGFYDALR